MGLYINSNDHDIYKTNQGLVEPNQGLFINRHKDQIVEEQKKIKAQLTQSLHELKHLYENQKNEQTIKWNEFTSQIEALQFIHERHEVLEKEVLEKLQHLKEDQDTLHHDAQERKLVDEELAKELNRIAVTQQSIDEKMATFHKVNQVLNEKIEKQMVMEKQLHEGLEKQGKVQEDVKKRLENQEALTEKVNRQLDHFRSILYERTNYLSEKIDKISTYVSNAILEDPLQRGRFVLKKENTKK